MNYIEGGTCHVTGRECLLGTSHEINHECAIRGDFDVWITCDDKVLISDIGPPSPEPKRSVALGVGKRVADEIAMLTALKTSGEIMTTQQRCRQCGRLYWITEHESSVTRLGWRRFCPRCIGSTDRSVGKFDVPDYWCG
jgi:ribosomal protein L33